jgi:hypothetical protein
MTNEHCHCPSPRGKAAISPTGYCPRCGVEGSRREQAMRDSLASLNLRPAIDQARDEGWAAGYRAGLIDGRREVIDALLDPAALPVPPLIGTTIPAHIDSTGVAA